MIATEAPSRSLTGRAYLADARIERGRTHRHALREAIAHERFDRLVIAAATGRAEGFQSDEIAWLLDHTPGEVVVIRPAGDDHRSARRRAIARANGSTADQCTSDLPELRSLM